MLQCSAFVGSWLVQKHKWLTAACSFLDCSYETSSGSNKLLIVLKSVQISKHLRIFIPHFVVFPQSMQDSQHFSSDSASFASLERTLICSLRC